MSKSIYPSVPAPGNTPESMRASLDAMRQTLTMVIMNAQNPNPTFTPSSAAQVFVTKEELKATGVVGAPGQTGPQGPPGPGIAEAPNDVSTYGRHALGWITVLPTIGGALTGPLSGTALTLSGLLALASAKFSTLPTDAVDDTAAATAGVAVGGVYRNGSVLMVRVT